MTTVRLMPEETHEMGKQVLRLESALDALREALDEGDTKLASAYLEVVATATSRLSEIHEQMAEPVPV